MTSEDEALKSTTKLQMAIYRWKGDQTEAQPDAREAMNTIREVMNDLNRQIAEMGDTTRRRRESWLYKKQMREAEVRARKEFE